MEFGYGVWLWGLRVGLACWVGASGCSPSYLDYSLTCSLSSLACSLACSLAWEQGYSRSQRPELARPSWRPGVGI